MDFSWLPKLLVPVAITGAFTIFRKFFPAKSDPSLERFDRPEGDRLPTGFFGILTVSLGIVIALGGYFALLAINHLLAKADGPALFRTYPTVAIWWFLPGFAALAIPWPFVIYCLRRSRYCDDAAYIQQEGNTKSGFDCYRVMAGMVLFLVIPIAIFTVPALPERLTLTDHDVRWTHYASLKPEVFSYADATRATIVDGYFLRNGSFESHWDLLIDFKDGRRLSANAVGDGGSTPDPKAVDVLLSKTGLKVGHVHTMNELHGQP